MNRITQLDQSSVKNEVKQGAVMSPMLFTLYTDPFIHKLKMSRKGCYVADKCGPVSTYADGIILLSLIIYAMQKLLDKYRDFLTDKCL